MLKSSIVASLLLSANLLIADGDSEYIESHNPMRVSARHIEAGGIGYKNGYTTLEAFLATSADPSLWVGFLDARGHVFNNAKFAFNGGLGLRKACGSRVYGVNGYYDYRKTSHKTYNQAGAGLETLGEVWDLRINGYLPFGRKITHPYNPTFGGFSYHSIIVDRKFEYAMKGIDGELGVHFGKTNNFDFYAAAGPYYFKGELGKGAFGGKGRLAAYYKEYVALEISDSYDCVFQNHVQGQLTFSFPFGPRSCFKSKSEQCSKNPSRSVLIANRMVQPVPRQEIIVVDTQTKSTLANNFIVFVNNLSSSLGTFESPYPTLLEAQENSSPNDIIYVFSGDGTTTGMNAGIILQDGQKFWGSSVSHTVNTNLGTITIPPQTSTAPKITGDIAITLAVNNEVSGFNISRPNTAGISGTDPGNVSISSTTIYQSGGDALALNYNTGTGMTALIEDVTITNGFARGLFILAQGDSNPTVTVNNSTIDANNLSGIQINLFGSGSINFGFNNSESNFNIGFGDGITVQLGTTSTIPSIFAFNNSRFTSNDSVGCNLQLLTDSPVICNWTGTEFIGNNSLGAQVIISNNVESTLNIDNCSFDNNLGGFGFSLQTAMATTPDVHLNLNNSSMSYNHLDGAFVVAGGNLPIDISITNCSFNGNGGTGIEFDPSHSLVLSAVGNTFAQNTSHGLFVNSNLSSATDSFNIDLTSNLFIGNRANGTQLQDSGISTESTNSISASSNFIMGNRGIGLSIYMPNTGATGRLAMNISDNTALDQGLDGVSVDLRCTSATFEFPINITGNIANNNNGTGLTINLSQLTTSVCNAQNNNFENNIIGGLTINSTDSASICFEFTGNTAYPFLFQNASTQPLNIAPCDAFSLNTGEFSEAGAMIIHVESCPGAAACP